MRRTYLITSIQALAGAGMGIWSGSTARLAAGPSRPAPAWLVRLLGARMAAQGIFVALAARRGSGRAALTAGSAVDALHGASMVAAAIAAPRYRRSAVLSAASALGSAGAGWRLARRPVGARPVA